MPSVTDDGRIVVTVGDGTSHPHPLTTATTPTFKPVDLPLALVLGKMPQKHFHLTSPADSAHTAPGVYCVCSSLVCVRVLV